MKLNGYTCSCNSLTNFKYVVQQPETAVRYVNLQKLACKNWYVHFGLSYFWQVLAICNHCALSPADSQFLFFKGTKAEDFSTNVFEYVFLVIVAVVTVVSIYILFLLVLY